MAVRDCLNYSTYHKVSKGKPGIFKKYIIISILISLTNFKKAQKQSFYAFLPPLTLTHQGRRQYTDPHAGRTVVNMRSMTNMRNRSHSREHRANTGHAGQRNRWDRSGHTGNSSGTVVVRNVGTGPPWCQCRLGMMNGMPHMHQMGWHTHLGVGII